MQYQPICILALAMASPLAISLIALAKNHGNMGGKKTLFLNSFREEKRKAAKISLFFSFQRLQIGLMGYVKLINLP